MYTDIVDLREFYGSSLGQVARRMVRRRIREIWPDVRGQSVLGLGYATPYLRPFRDEAERVLAVMPAAQGVAFWPPEGPGQVALADEAELPLPNMSVDRVLLVHGLEGTEQLRPMMREVWRVLAGGGRLLTVVPNRRGLWTRADWTPFGHGSPYTVSQLKRVLRDNNFVPEKAVRALFIPPVRSRFMLGWAPVWEQLGDRWFGTFAGVVLVEATKQLYAPVARRAVPMRNRLLVPLPRPQGATRADARPAAEAAARETEEAAP